MSKIPENIEQLIKILKKQTNVSDYDVEKVQEALEEDEHDILSIKEDMSDKEQSLLIDFCRDDTDYGEKLWDIIYSIVHGTFKPSEKTKDDIKTEEEALDEITENEPNEEKEEQPKEIDNDVSVNFFESDDEKEWDYDETEDATNNSSTEILSAGNIFIPNKVITDSKYLENVKGITYVLSYNNAKNGIRPPRIRWSYVKFWLEWLEDDETDFKTIAEDIKNKEGPTYDYLMENPPNDRILGILEKVVDQLAHPMLKNMKDLSSSRKKHYKQQIADFFKCQCPNYRLKTTLHETLSLFKCNTNETNFDTFELFVTIQDIVDRIFYDFDRFGIDSPHQIIGNREHLKETDQKENNVQQHHFAADLQKNEYDALAQSLIAFKDEKEKSFYPTLQRKKEQQIGDNLVDFQRISLSFILFVKAFMSVTGNCLEKLMHVRKKPKLKHLRKRDRPFLDTLKTIKTASWKEEKKDWKNVKIDDLDCDFHNLNMPLQFDLCIIPRSNNEKYGLESNNFTDFEIESDNFKIPTDRKSIWELYGKMVMLFVKVMKKESIRKAPKESKKEKKQKGAPQYRDDDRYIIAIDLSAQKMYMYPPRIDNGKDCKITHRRPVTRETNKQQQQKKEKSNGKNNASESKEQQPDNESKEKDKKDEKVQNKFSFIAYEHNELTNFYLTSQCVLPSNEGKKYFGAKDLEFVFSAHFHKQRQWHKHPKLRFYQYFNGGAMRFLHHNGHSEKRYKYEQDLFDLWPKYFKNSQNGLTQKEVDTFDIFDGVMDLYKCDAEFFRWDNAVKRCIFDKYVFTQIFQKDKLSNFDRETLKMQMQSDIGQKQLKLLKIPLLNELLTSKDMVKELKKYEKEYGDKWKSAKNEIVKRLNQH